MSIIDYIYLCQYNFCTDTLNINYLLHVLALRPSSGMSISLLAMLLNPYLDANVHSAYFLSVWGGGHNNIGQYMGCTAQPIVNTYT
jgi:hypothetical protein